MGFSHGSHEERQDSEVQVSTRDSYPIPYVVASMLSKVGSYERIG